MTKISSHNNPKFVVVKKPGTEYEVFPATEESLPLIQSFLGKSEAVIYRIEFYVHHPNTAREEWLPHTVKRMEVNSARK